MPIVGLVILGLLFLAGSSKTATPPPPPPPPPPPSPPPAPPPVIRTTTPVASQSHYTRQAPGASPPPGWPAVLQNDTLGHTNIPQGMFVGLPLQTVMQIDQAYQSGNVFLMAASAEAVKKAGGDQGLVLQIQADAKRSSVQGI